VGAAETAGVLAACALAAGALADTLGAVLAPLVLSETFMTSPRQ
jgi:hypothetical protein